jgi:ribosomal protein S27E
MYYPGCATWRNEFLFIPSPVCVIGGTGFLVIFFTGIFLDDNSMNYSQVRFARCNRIGCGDNTVLFARHSDRANDCTVCGCPARQTTLVQHGKAAGPGLSSPGTAPVAMPRS